MGTANIGCDLLALLTFVLGMGAGTVLTYIPLAYRVAKLRHKVERREP